MTITVNGPNGVTINFPEGTDAGTIQSVMDQAIGHQEPAKPEHISQPSSLDTTATTLGGMIEGIPILGPIIRGGTERAAAGTLSLVSGKPYDEVLKLVQDDKARMKEEHPYLDAGSQIAGGIAATIPVAATATGAKALGITGGNLLERTGAGLLSGAAITGADSAIRSGGDLQATGEGLKLGGLVGAAVPVVGAGIGAGMRAGKAALSPATQALVNRIRPEGQGADLTLKALERDGLTIDDAAQKLATMQKTAPDAVLADVGGANTRGLARAAVNTPGVQREAVQSFIEARNLAQPQRITENLASVLENPDDFGKTAAKLAAERERIAGPIYEKSFSEAKPVNVSGVVDYIDKKVLPGSTGVMSPVADLRPDGITATIGRLRNFFATETNQRFDLHQLHQIKMELDDMIGSAKRAGDNGKARAILGVQNRLVKAMDTASPDYKRARNIYSSTHELDDALEFGTGVLRMKPSEVKAGLDGMTEAQRSMVQLGTARALADTIAGMRDGHDVVKRIFATQALRDSLRSVFKDPQAYRKFQLMMTREARMRKTADAVRGNSTTAGQLQDLADIQGGGTFGRDVFSMVMDGQLVKAAATAVRQVLKGEQGLNEKVAAKLSDMLLSKEPMKIQAAINVLKKRRGAMERLHGRLSTIGTRGAAITGQAAQIPYRSSLSD